MRIVFIIVVLLVAGCQTMPPDPQTLTDEAIAAFDAGDYQTALDKFDMATQVAPDNEWLYYNRGLVYYEIGEYRAAFEDLTTAINMEWEPIFFYWRARTFDELGGRYRSDAIDDYRMFIRLTDGPHPLVPDARQRWLGIAVDEIVVPDLDEG